MLAGGKQRHQRAASNGGNISAENVSSVKAWHGGSSMAASIGSSSSMLWRGSVSRYRYSYARD